MLSPIDMNPAAIRNLLVEDAGKKRMQDEVVRLHRSDERIFYEGHTDYLRCFHCGTSSDVSALKADSYNEVKCPHCNMRSEKWRVSTVVDNLRTIARFIKAEQKRKKTLPQAEAAAVLLKEARKAIEGTGMSLYEVLDNLPRYNDRRIDTPTATLQ